MSHKSVIEKICHEEVRFGKKINRAKKIIAYSYSIHLSTSYGILSVELLWVPSLRSEMYFDQIDHKTNDVVYFFDHLCGVHSSLRTGSSLGLMRTPISKIVTRTF